MCTPQPLRLAHALAICVSLLSLNACDSTETAETTPANALHYSQNTTTWAKETTGYYYQSPAPYIGDAFHHSIKNYVDFSLSGINNYGCSESNYSVYLYDPDDNLIIFARNIPNDMIISQKLEDGTWVDHFPNFHQPSGTRYFNKRLQAYNANSGSWTFAVTRQYEDSGPSYPSNCKFNFKISSPRYDYL